MPTKLIEKSLVRARVEAIFEIVQPLVKYLRTKVQIKSKIDERIVTFALAHMVQREIHHLEQMNNKVDD